jgi:hypothetical protein
MNKSFLPNIPGGTVTCDGQGIMITDRWLVVNGKRYALADLHDLHIVTWSTCRVRLASLIGAVALPAAALLAAPYASSAALWESVALTSCALLLVAVATLKTHPRRHAIWAVVRPSGNTVELFATSDATLCGKWARLIARAASAARDPARQPHRDAAVNRPAPAEPAAAQD